MENIMSLSTQKSKGKEASVIQKLGGLYDKKYKGWGYEKIYDSNPSGSQDSMSNDKQSQQAQNNQQQSNSGQGNNNQQYSDEYKAGWARAIEDYKNGKLKL